MTIKFSSLQSLSSNVTLECTHVCIGIEIGMVQYFKILDVIVQGGIVLMEYLRVCANSWVFLLNQTDSNESHP